MRVDATVLDRRGESVLTLTADEFRLESNVPQRIVQSRLVELTGHQVLDNDLSLPAAAPSAG